MQLCKGSGPDVGSQVGMHKCPDACTYSDHSFEKNRLFIFDYIKLSSIYQVKCKLVDIEPNHS